MAHAVLDQLVDVADTERPVRHAHRQSVHRDFHHESVRDFLEVHRVVVEPGAHCQLLDARQELAPFAAICAHCGSLACCWKKWRTASQISSMRLTAKLPAGLPSSPRALNRPPVSVAS